MTIKQHWAFCNLVLGGGGGGKKIPWFSWVGGQTHPPPNVFFLGGWSTPRIPKSVVSGWVVATPTQGQSVPAPLATGWWSTHPAVYLGAAYTRSNPMSRRSQGPSIMASYIEKFPSSSASRTAQIWCRSDVPTINHAQEHALHARSGHVRGLNPKL